MVQGVVVYASYITARSRSNSLNRVSVKEGLKRWVRRALDVEGHVDAVALMIVVSLTKSQWSAVLQFGFCQRRSRLRGPIHWLQTSVDAVVRNHLLEEFCW